LPGSCFAVAQVLLLDGLKLANAAADLCFHVIGHGLEVNRLARGAAHHGWPQKRQNARKRRANLDDLPMTAARF